MSLTVPACTEPTLGICALLRRFFFAFASCFFLSSSDFFSPAARRGRRIVQATKYKAPSSSSRRIAAISECAPNGYFYLPMYDPGAYVVRLEAPPVRGSLGVSARALEARRSLCVYARLIVRGVRVSVAAYTDAVAPTRDEVAWKGA
jgi:hypothetical protein